MIPVRCFLATISALDLSPVGTGHEPVFFLKEYSTGLLVTVASVGAIAMRIPLSGRPQERACSICEAGSSMEALC